MQPLFFLISSIVYCINAEKQCVDSYQCENEVITDSDITCSGYYSCDQASITSNGYINCSATFGCNEINELTADRNIYCSGFKSCNVANNNINGRIVECSGSNSCNHYNPNTPNNPNPFIISADISIHCSGMESCYSSQTQSGKKTYCEGQNSCTRSTINAGDTVYCDGSRGCINSSIHSMLDVICSGSSSCDGSTITASQQVLLYGFESGINTNINSPIIDGYGYHSLNNATIDSMGQQKMNIKLFGDGSGNDAIINCRHGSECNLFCKNTACKGLTFNCEYDAICSISPNGCFLSSNNSIISINGIDCPIFNNVETGTIPYLSDTLNMDFVSEKTDDYDVGLIKTDNNNNNMINCDNKRECSSIMFNVTGITDVECNGFESCLSAEIKERFISETATFKTLKRIDCYGENSCNSAILKTKIGSINCYGDSSCYNADIIGKNIKCMGYESCKDISRKIVSFEMMKCEATSSCHGSYIDSNLNIECMGNRACSKSNNIKSATNIICDGHYSCSSSKLNANGYIECNGKGSCHNTEINVTERICIYGHYGAAYSTIYAKDIRGFGYHSLIFVTIDSQSLSKIEIHSFGHLGGYGASVICRANTKCTVVCKGSGCKNLDFICLEGSICSVLPAKCTAGKLQTSQGIDCPNILKDLTDNDLMSIIKRKKYNIKHDDIYKKMLNEIEENNDEFQLLQNDDDYDINNDDLLLFHKLELFPTISIVHLRIFCGIILIVFVVTAICCWYYSRNEYEAIK